MTWVVRMRRSEAAGCGILRKERGVQVCPDEDWLWVKGDADGEEIERLLALLPGGRRYHLGAGGLVTPRGMRLPAGRLPEQGWTPLPSYLVPVLAAKKASFTHPPRAPVRMVRSVAAADPGLLLAQGSVFAAYAHGAPAVRLAPLRFAASGDGTVLILGLPLPPIPGQLYYEREGIYLPLGLTWDPPVDAVVLREVMSLEANELALILPDGSYEVVPGRALVPASRAAIRLTMARL